MRLASKRPERPPNRRTRTGRLNRTRSGSIGSELPNPKDLRIPFEEAHRPSTTMATRDEAHDAELRPTKEFETKGGGKVQVFHLGEGRVRTEEDPERRQADEDERKGMEEFEEQLRRKLYRDPLAPSATLDNGAKIPLVGLGTWKSDPGQVGAAVRMAIQEGYRHVDCAEIYNNEQEIGEALREVFKDGVVSREDLFITSKLWNTDHAPERVRPALLKSLAHLDVPYLDLYLIHWPVTGNVGPELKPTIKETWQEMEKLVDEGLVKAIGVSNFSVKKLEDMLGYARVKPSVVQCEGHPYFRNDRLRQWCEARGIHFTAYSPLGSPDSTMMFRSSRNNPKLMEDPTVVSIAKELGKSPAQVLLRWAVQRGTSVLPKSTNRDRIRMNLELFSWELPQTLFNRLNTLPMQKRMLEGDIWLNAAGPYKTYEDLWDEDKSALSKPVVRIPSCVGTASGGKQLYATLNTGQKMPCVGLGTWKSKPGEVRDATLAALKAGYVHIDCAEIYENEEEVGDAISQALKEGVITRDEVFITSKLWNTDHAKDQVGPACRKTLKHLGLDCLDLYLIHWPITGNKGPKVDPPLEETWKAMEDLVDKGLVKAIGVSNYSISKMQALMEYARIPPAVLQVEIHPYFRNDDLILWCREKGIHVTAYSSLGSPDSASMFANRKNVPKLMDHPVVKEVAESSGHNVGQVLLRWGVQRGLTVLPKSVNPSRIASNLQLFDWQLTEEEFEKLSTFEEQYRMLDGSFWLHPQGPYKTVEDLWG